MKKASVPRKLNRKKQRSPNLKRRRKTIGIGELSGRGKKKIHEISWPVTNSKLKTVSAAPEDCFLHRRLSLVVVVTVMIIQASVDYPCPSGVFAVGRDGRRWSEALSLQTPTQTTDEKTTLSIQGTVDEPHGADDFRSVAVIEVMTNYPRSRRSCP
jgi:hypothetical protein